MRPITNTEHFCTFAPPHGHTKFLGVIKTGVRQRQAVGLCPIDWRAPELEPLLKWDGYSIARWRVFGMVPGSTQGLTRLALVAPLGVPVEWHPSQTVPYCEYHGGTRQSVAAGEWCVLCEEVRKWALAIIQKWSQHSSEVRKAALQGTRHMDGGYIISPDLLDWGVAIGTLSLFSDQQARKVLQEQLNSTPVDALQRIEESSMLGGKGFWKCKMVKDAEASLPALRDILWKSRDGSEIWETVSELCSDRFLPLIQDEAWAELFARIILRPVDWSSGVARENFLCWDDVYHLIKFHFLKGSLEQPLTSSSLTRAFYKAFQDQVASGTMPKDEWSQNLIKYILKDCQHV